MARSADRPNRKASSSHPINAAGQTRAGASGATPDRHRQRNHAVDAAARAFLAELAVRRVLTFRHRVGGTHIKNRMPAVPELPVEDQLSSSRSAGHMDCVPWPNSTNFSVIAALRKAGLEKPRLEMLKVPAVETRS